MHRRRASRAVAALTGLAAAFLVTACAPSTVPVQGSGVAVGSIGATMGQVARGAGVELTTRVEGMAFTLAGVDADRAFAALRATYEAFKIPPSRLDESTRTIANDGLRMRRELGAFETRRIFDCGGASGMPNAETYNITATIASSVTVVDGSAVVTTVVDGSGENPNFTGSGGVRCSTQGFLEAQIEKGVRARLQGSK